MVKSTKPIGLYNLGFTVTMISELVAVVFVFVVFLYIYDYFFRFFPFRLFIVGGDDDDDRIKRLESKSHTVGLTKVINSVVVGDLCVFLFLLLFVVWCFLASRIENVWVVIFLVCDGDGH